MKPVEVYKDKCRHFNGIQHECCRAGVRYKDVELMAEDHPRRRLPCAEFSLPHAARVPDTCPVRSLLTQEEHAEKARELDAAVDRMLSLNAAGKCHTCEAPIEPSKLVGRCLYASCGHRIGQVSEKGPVAGGDGHG